MASPDHIDELILLSDHAALVNHGAAPPLVLTGVGNVVRDMFRLQFLASLPVCLPHRLGLSQYV